VEPAEVLMQSDIDLANVLADIIGRPSWMGDAACAEYPVDVFFPSRGEPVDPARTICAHCPVLEECAAFVAGEAGPVHGVWAGRSQRQRDVARRSVA
jgi:hypothetical protein